MRRLKGKGTEKDSGKGSGERRCRKDKSERGYFFKVEEMRLQRGRRIETRAGKESLKEKWKGELERRAGKESWKGELERRA